MRAQGVLNRVCSWDVPICRRTAALLVSGAAGAKVDTACVSSTAAARLLLLWLLCSLHLTVQVCHEHLLQAGAAPTNSLPGLYVTSVALVSLAWHHYQGSDYQ
jgi:hypothetical protein